MSRMKKKRRCEVDYLLELHRLCDLIYQRAVDKDWSWADLAKKAGLSSQTVSKLGNRETRFPEARTLLLLCKAVGLQIEFRRLEQKANFKKTTRSRNNWRVA